MQGRMTIIRATDGHVIVADFTGPITLEELQSAVDGYIETVPYFNRFNGNRCVAFCNEEGKLQGLPTNIIATRLWHEQIKMPDDVLVGDVCIMTGNDEFMKEL